MKRILITGSDGFIGSHLVEHAVQAGYEVRAFVLYNSFGSRGWLDTVSKPVQEAIEVIPGDVRDAVRVREAMRGCDGVLHLAALIGIPYSYVAPESYVDVNIKGTLNIVQAARDLGIEKVVHTSTSEVYGSAQFVPITEEHPLVGQSPYSASKIAADQMAMSYHHAFEVPVAIARPFNTYGPRQSTRAVIPTIITQLAAGKETLSLGSLEPTRDFNFVADTVRGMLAILESPRSVGEVINLGSGFEISIGDLVTLIGEVMDKPVKVEADETRMRPKESEVDRLLAANAKAHDLLDWVPEYGSREGLKQGLREAADWFLSAGATLPDRTGDYSI